MKTFIMILKYLVTITLAILTIKGLQSFDGYPMDNIALRMAVGGLVFSAFLLIANIEPKDK